MTAIYHFLDLVLIAPYRVGLPSGVAFWLGTAILSLWCVVLGEASMAIGYLINRSYYLDLNKKMVTMNNLSIEAIRRKQKTAYKAANTWANEYFGRAFFAQAALFAVSLWPLPFALAWMQIRFDGIDIVTIPFMHYGLEYPFAFLSSYIFVRFCFSKSKTFLPGMKKLEMLKEQDASLAGTMLSWNDFPHLAGRDTPPVPDEEPNPQTLPTSDLP